MKPNDTVSMSIGTTIIMLTMPMCTRYRLLMCAKAGRL